MKKLIILSFPLFLMANESICIKDNMNINKLIPDTYSIMKSKKTKCNELNQKQVGEVLQSPILNSLSGLNELVIESENDNLKNCFQFGYDVIVKKAIDKKITDPIEFSNLIKSDFFKNIEEHNDCKNTIQDLKGGI